LQGFKLQFEIYLVPTKPLVVPENLRKLIQILMTHTVYTKNINSIFSRVIHGTTSCSAHSLMKFVNITFLIIFLIGFSVSSAAGNENAQSATASDCLTDYLEVFSHLKQVKHKQVL
jgi:hypothetical protein